MLVVDDSGRCSSAATTLRVLFLTVPHTGTRWALRLFEAIMRTPATHLSVLADVETLPLRFVHTSERGVALADAMASEFDCIITTYRPWESVRSSWLRRAGDYLPLFDEYERLCEFSERHNIESIDVTKPDAGLIARLFGRVIDTFPPNYQGDPNYHPYSSGVF